GTDEILTGREILNKHPTGQKYAFILREHSRFPLFIDAENKVLSMPPIINARDLGEIKVGEKSILVETTGTHKETMMQTINILATMFADMGGKIYSVKIVYPKNKEEKAPYFNENAVCLDINYARKILGLNLSVKQVVKMLEKMGFLIKSFENSIIYVVIPPYRTDIFHEIDIIDDIARAYGFDRFEPELTPVFTVGSEIQYNEKINFIRDIMIGLGFSEMFTFSLTSIEDQFTKMRISIPRGVVRIAGAKEAKINMVRYWLLPEILKALAENKAKEYPIKMFEIEDIVEIAEDLEAKAKNKTHLCAIISSTKISYTQIRSAMEYVFQSIESPIEIRRYNHGSFIEGRCAAIFFKDKKVGIMGEVHPEVLNNFSLSMPVVAAEVDLSRVLDIKVKEIEWA
ncbi:MAG: phenylalanine--tRNA ligase subunit beta, partial [Candidatus Njordarchaeota archaeon]